MAFSLLLSLSLFAQEAEEGGNYGTPKNMLEVGLSGGHVFISGDVSPTLPAGFGGGIHIRKAIDYIFSVRLDGFYSLSEGEEQIGNEFRRYESAFMAGTAFGVISANSLRFNSSVRKTNLYGMVGAGASYYAANSLVKNEPIRPSDELNEGEYNVSPHIAAGVGIAFRLSPRVNIGLEHQAFITFGNQADRLDGLDLGTNNFRDVLNYTSLKLNFNIGSKSKLSEPLYWINPLDNIITDLTAMKEDNKLALQDSDGDGVIDAIDQDPNTPPDVPVDTKGRVLDSDRDGVPDYKDREPYFPPRPGERVDEEGVVVNPISPSGDGVSEDRVREIIAEELQNYSLRQGEEGGAIGGGSGGGMAEWFLPMIHFGTDSDRVKYSDYGTLSSIARMMKGNPNLRLVVTGFADSSAPESYNDELSYRRADAVIKHLVDNHGIGRGRLILQWKGETELLVQGGGSYMNRRVEFRVAQGDDVEMDPPAGISKENDGF